MPTWSQFHLTCLVFCCFGGWVLADPPEREVPYTLDAALGGGVVALGNSGERLRAGLRELFSADLPDGFHGWMAQLSSGSFRQRELAVKQLYQFLGDSPMAVTPLLSAGLQSPDPEVRMRCRWLLDLSPPQKLDGILEWMLLEQIPGMLGFLEKVPPSMWEGPRELRLPDVVAAVARQQDRERLQQQWTKHPLPVFRKAAVRGLAKIGAAANLAPLEADPDPSVRLEVALHWARHSDPRCLALFKKLVADSDFLVSGTSAYALQRLSGQFFGFPGTGGKEKRLAIAKAWGDLPIDRPRFPLQLPVSILSNAPTGRSLYVLEEGQGMVSSCGATISSATAWSVARGCATATSSSSSVAVTARSSSRTTGKSCGHGLHRGECCAIVSCSPPATCWPPPRLVRWKSPGGSRSCGRSKRPGSGRSGAASKGRFARSICPSS